MDSQEHTNSTHHGHEHRKAVLDRLSRIEGHVRAVRRMVEQDEECPDVLVQIAAVRSALNSVGRVILEDHVKSCLMNAAEEGEFEKAFKDLRNSLDRFIG
jgi:DNA-binding FrmR family transcriptional regulator